MGVIGSPAVRRVDRNVVERRRTLNEGAVDLIRASDLIESGEIEALESARNRLLRVECDARAVREYAEAKIAMLRATRS